MSVIIFFLSLMGGTPAVDDSPCPAGTTAVVLEGSTYSHNVWSLDGQAWGVSLEEDECIVVLS